MAKTYATLNPSDKDSHITLSNGNLTATKTQDQVAYANVRSTIAKTTGKWYWEVHLDGYTNAGVDGLATVNLGLTSFPSSEASAWVDNGSNHAGIVNNSIQFTFAHPASGDTMGLAYDADAATLKIYKNNTLMGTLTGVVGTYALCSLFYAADVQTFNFGATAMAYTAPTGYNQGLYDESVSVKPISNLPLLGVG